MRSVCDGWKRMPLCNDVYAGINPEYPEELVSGTIKFLYILITKTLRV